MVVGSTPSITTGEPIALADERGLIHLESTSMCKQQGRASHGGEEQLHEFADAIPQIIWIAAADGSLTYLNAKATEYVGVAIHELTEWSWTRAIHPDDLPQTLELWKSAINDGIPRDIEFRIRRFDGVYRWHIGRQVATRDESGVISSWYGTCTDIEDLKRTQKALNENETWFRSVLDHYPAAVFLKDLNGKYLYVNRYFSDVSNSPQEDWIGKRAYDFFPAELAAQFERNDQLVTQTLKPRQDEEFYVLPDGSNLCLSMTQFPLFHRDGGLYATCGITSDITERKRAEKTWRDAAQSLQLFRALVDMSNDAIFVMDPATSRFLDVSQQACARLGYSREELLQLGVVDIEVNLPQPADWHQHVERVRASGNLILEGAHRCKNGSTVPVEISVSHVKIDRDEYMVAVVRDVSERKLAERALRRSEERFSKLFYASPFSIIVASFPEGKIVEANDAFLRLFEFEREEVIGKTTGELNMWANADDRLFMIDQLRAGESARDMEILFRTKLGRYRTLVMSVEIIRIDGELYSLAMSIDITARKEAERQLRLNQFSVDHAVDSVFWISPSSEILYVNDAVCQTLGYSRQEMVGRTVSEIDSNFPLEAWPAHWAELKRRGSLTFESQHTTKDGRLLDTEVTANYLLYEGREYNCAVMRDITGRRRSELAIQQTLSRLQATLESTADGILVVDLNGRIIDFNQQFLSIWQIPLDLLAQGPREKQVATLNTHAAIAAMLSQLKDAASVNERLEQIYAAPDTPSHDSLEFKDGRVVERHSLPQCIDGKPVGRVWSFRDVSQQKQLEEQLRQSQKMEAIGQLAGGIAHDFNNLLTVINGYCDLMLEYERHGGDGWRQSVLEVREAGRRAAQLTEQLLTFGRRSPLQSQTVNLNDVIDNSEKLLRRLIGEQIELAVELEPCVMAIKADTNQLEQVLMNLAVNAKDAMPEGGRLSIQTKLLSVSGEGQSEQKATPVVYAQLQVSDTGVGMTKEIQSRIFEPFFTTKAVGQGSGLGLSVVHGITRQHDGSIQVASLPGQGTTFTLLFPLVESDVTHRPTIADTDKQRGTETILLVEDEEGVRKLTRVMLESQGYRVLDAPNGLAAIHFVKNCAEPIDLLVTDVVMPEAGGRKLAEEMRSHNPDLRVLYISGYNPDAAIRSTSLHSKESFLKKPFKLEQLANAVRHAIDNIV